MILKLFHFLHINEGLSWHKAVSQFELDLEEIVADLLSTPILKIRLGVLEDFVLPFVVNDV
jgi:hypothetical protein